VPAQLLKELERLLRLSDRRTRDDRELIIASARSRAEGLAQLLEGSRDAARVVGIGFCGDVLSGLWLERPVRGAELKRLVDRIAHVIGIDANVASVAIYLRALTFLFLPVTPATTRLPGVIVCAVDVVLTYIVARRLFRRESLAILAAIFVMLTPAHFIHARLATDHICHLPFFIASVWFVLDYIERRTLRSICLANLCLGLGIYGYNGAMTTMPVYGALTWVLLFFGLRERSPKPYVAAALGFLIALAPLVPWLLVHPEQVTNQLSSYQVGQASGAGAGSAAGGGLYAAVVPRLDAYYHFFDPSLLFFTGDGSLTDSTGEVGVFLLPLAVLLPAAVFFMVKRERSLQDRFVLMAFAAGPIGALIVAESKMTRALVMVPLAALIAVRGVEGLMSQRKLAWRLAAIALVAATAMQFRLFYGDYVGNYRERASFWFEGNREGAFEYLVSRTASTPAARIYINNQIPLVTFSWQFYAIEHRRPDLKNRATYFDQTLDMANVPDGSLFMATFNPDPDPMLERWPSLKRTALIDDAGHHPSFAIYQK